jgi:hypothetical protein
MGIALFLGAGFSRWAVDLPVASGLFDFRIEPSTREKNRLEKVKPLKETWDKENPNELAEQFIADALSLSPKQGEDVIWYIARRLSEPFVINIHPFQKPERHILAIDDAHRSDELTPKKWFFRTLMLLANLRRIDFVEKRGILEPVRT